MGSEVEQLKTVKTENPHGFSTVSKRVDSTKNRLRVMGARHLFYFLSAASRLGRAVVRERAQNKCSPRLVTASLRPARLLAVT